MPGSDALAQAWNGKEKKKRKRRYSEPSANKELIRSNVSKELLDR